MDGEIKGNVHKFDARDERSVYFPQLVDFNFSSIAKVCETDISTIEHMY